MTFDGKQLSLEDVRRPKTTFNGRQAWMQDGLRQKKTLDGRRPLMEEDLLWKTAFDGGQPLMEKYLRLNHSNKRDGLGGTSLSTFFMSGFHMFFLDI